MTIKDFGLILGWLISAVLALLKILEYRRDKASIKVTVRGNYGIIPEDTRYGSGNKIVITVANRGRRPVTLTHAALLMPRNSKTHYLVSVDALSRTVKLGEGESHTYLLNEDEAKKKYNLTPDKYVACVIDATGRHYWSHSKLKRLIKLGRIK